MMLILPDYKAIQICALCNDQAFYLAILKIKAFDSETAKSIMAQMNFVLCERHADKMDICIEKIIKADKKQIIFV
jgi:hypothetical protein